MLANNVTAISTTQIIVVAVPAMIASIDDLEGIAPVVKIST